MTANQDVIYYTMVAEDGSPLFSRAATALFDPSLDAWVDDHTGASIEFLGLVLGSGATFASRKLSEVEKWISSNGNP